MGGGRVQLLARGAQDDLLTGNPQVSFWKRAYKRHTRFAVETVRQQLLSVPAFGASTSAVVSRNGDLITHVVVRVTLPRLAQPVVERDVDTPAYPYWDYDTGAPALRAVAGLSSAMNTNGEALVTPAQINNDARYYARYVNCVGHALLRRTEVRIGGQRVDCHYSAFAEMMDELTCSEEKRLGYARMIGKRYAADGVPADDYDPAAQTAVDGTGLETQMGQSAPATLYVPLRFWFNRTTGHALPLIALRHHDVELTFDLRAFEDLVVYDVGAGPRTMRDDPTTRAPQGAAVEFWNHPDTGGSAAMHFVPGALAADGSRVPAGTESLQFDVFVDNVFLDANERAYFETSQHEYLIQQLQAAETRTLVLPGGDQERLRLTLPFKHACTELLLACHADSDARANRWFAYGETARNADGGVGAERVRSAALVLNSQEPVEPLPGAFMRSVVPYRHHTRIPMRHVYVTSFALAPEDTQPSGSCNLSRIRDARMDVVVANDAPHSDAFTVIVYALSHNVLRIAQGTASVAFAL
jgi:hypothetical protein